LDDFIKRTNVEHNRRLLEQTNQKALPDPVFLGADWRPPPSDENLKYSLSRNSSMCSQFQSLPSSATLPYVARCLAYSGVTR
jgi:hypothetical protein